MSTPLETFLHQAMQSPQDVLLDRARMAIGTDKDGYSPLLDGIKQISHITNRIKDEDKDWIRVPYCYAWERVVKKELANEYDPKANEQWTRRIVTGSEQEQAPLLCHVFHKASSEAILAIKAGHLDLAEFLRTYRGGTEATYKEVCTVIEAGYTEVSDAGWRYHCILLRK